MLCSFRYVYLHIQQAAFVSYKAGRKNELITKYLDVEGAQNLNHSITAFVEGNTMEESTRSRLVHPAENVHIISPPGLCRHENS